ncbi:uncharacterized protein LOC106874759 isoform X3, partial [Argonauta hians]
CCCYGQSWECEPENHSVPLGSNVTICCIWRKDIEVIFLKDNFLFIRGTTGPFNPEQAKRFKILSNGRFTITDVQKSDDTFYGCSTSTRTGQPKNSNIKVNVLLPPGKPVITGRNLYREGETIKLTCSSTGGKPPPQLNWVVKNKKHSDKTNHNGDTSSIELQLPVNRTFNGDQVTCMAENVVNKNNPILTNFTLDVQYPPSVIMTPDYNPYRVIEGNPVTLTCRIDANPKPTSADFWRGSTTLQSANAAELSNGQFFYRISAVKARETGELTCRAKNDLATNSANLSLEVLYKPQLKVQASVTVNITDSVQFQCNSDANPVANKLSWSPSDGVITNTPSMSQATLRITSASKSHAGNYTCTAYNTMIPSNGAAVTARSIAITTLFVQYAPGQATLTSNSVPIKGAEPISLTCRLDPKDRGFPSPSYLWRREGKVVNQARSSPILTIDRPTLSDSGRYTCTARNLMGSSSEGYVVVDVKEYPEITRGLPNQITKRENESMAPLECIASGNPAPTFIWLKDGELVSGHNYRIEQTALGKKQVSSKLYFEGGHKGKKNSQLTPFDSGEYSCVAQTTLNSNIKNVSSMLLIIESAPYSRKDFKVVAVSLKNPSNISILVDAYPRPQFYWTKDNRPLAMKADTTELDNNTFRSTLSFRYAIVSDLGVYTCFINNSLGQVTVTRDVRRRSVPDAPRDLGSIDATWESVYLQWKPGFDGGENQTFLIYKTVADSGLRSSKVVEVPVGNTRHAHYNVTGLMPNTVYNFTVRGWNNLGNGSFSNYFAMQTQSLKLPTVAEASYYPSTQLVKFKVNSEYDSCASLRINTHIKSLWCNISLQSTTNNTLKIGYTDVLKLEVRLCLRQRHALCGPYFEANTVNKKMSENSLSTVHMIVIAVVCSVILIVLVVVLILFLYWRNKAQKKQYGNEVNYPHMANGSVVGNGMPRQQVYDNPDGPYSNGYIENKHNTSSEHTDELPPYTDNDIVGHEMSDESDPEKPYDAYRNDSTNHELPPTYSDACKNPAEKPGDLSFYSHPQSPTRNMNFVSLNPDGMPRDTSTSGRESGYSTPDSSRPKKRPGERHHPNHCCRTSQKNHHETPGQPCTNPCCVEDLKLQSPKRSSSCLPNFGLLKSSDRFQENRRLLWNRPLLSAKTFSFPKLGTRQVERKNSVLKSEKNVDKDLELVPCGMKTLKPKTNSQTLHFDFSHPESHEEYMEEEEEEGGGGSGGGGDERNKSSEKLLGDMSNFSRDAAPNTFRRSKSTFMPIPQVTETQFNVNLSDEINERRDQVYGEISAQTKNSPRTTASSSRVQTNPHFSSENRSPQSTLKSSYKLNDLNNSSAYSPKYIAMQAPPHYATAKKSSAYNRSPVTSLHSAPVQYNSSSSMVSFSSPLISQKPLGTNLSKYTTSKITSADISTPIFEPKYSSNSPLINIHNSSTSRESEIKYADVTSLKTSKAPGITSSTYSTTTPIRTQFNRISQMAAKSHTKGILKNTSSSSQSSIETHSSNNQYPVYESIDDLRYIDDTSSETSSFMDQRTSGSDDMNRNNRHSSNNSSQRVGGSVISAVL